MVAQVYGRFKPDTEDRDRWERVETSRDAEKWKRWGATGGAGNSETLHNSDE